MLALALLTACARAPCEVVAWADADGDGFGDPAAPRCRADEGVRDDRDCDDGDPRVHPGAPESCDLRDEDCDGWPDDHPEPPRWLDRDGDGWGSVELPNCDAWGVDAGGDCDDDDPFLTPETPWYRDADGDGVGFEEVGTGCARPEPAAVRASGDCDDDDPRRSPLARETCGGADLDCDPTNDESGAWMVPDAVARLSVTVHGAHDVPLLLDLDGAPVDPTTARVFLQDCSAPRELPSALLAGESRLRTAGAPGIGDSVVALWDEDGDPTTIEPWPADPVSLAVYVGGAAAPAWATDLTSGDLALGAGGARFEVDVARGALLSVVGDAVGTVAGQAQATAGNGLRTPEGPLSVAAAPGEAALTDASAVTAALGTSAEAANPAGRFTYDARWRVFAGRAALLGRVSMVAVEATGIEGVEDRTEPIRPLQLRSPLADAACTTDPALGWGDLSDAERGVTWAWVAPPRWVNFAGCGADETWTSANDLPEGDPDRGGSGTVPAGQPIVDGGVVVLLLHGAGGAAGDAGRRRAWVDGPTITRGAWEE
jgi:hypothetical protein